MEYLLSQWPLLICPLVMGPMMWLMMRMNRTQEMPPETDSIGPSMATPAAGDATVDERLAVLRAELAEIASQQAAVGAQIERLSIEPASVEPSNPSSTESIARTSWRSER